MRVERVEEIVEPKLRAVGQPGPTLIMKKDKD